MPFKEQEAKSEYQVIDGKKVHVITPEVEITLTNTETGKEYMSDKEADDDVDNPETDTTTFEAEIDQLVYHLYGLTDEEIQIVEEGVSTP